MVHMDRNLVKILLFQQIAKELPIFLQLFRRNEASVITIKKIQALLMPDFSEEGSNEDV